MISYELDHIFICVSPGGPEADLLVNLGFTEGTPNTHPGQGTSNRRFFFSNCFLELIWVHDPLEAKSDLVAPTGLWDRWNGRLSGACPFGFGVRHGKQPTPHYPFPTWEYHPPYVPDPIGIPVALNSGQVCEPMFFFLPQSTRPDEWPNDRQQPLTHKISLREITGVELVSKNLSELSSSFKAVSEMGIIHSRPGAQFHLELIFDNESQGLKVDLRPELTLVLRW